MNGSKEGAGGSDGYVCLMGPLSFQVGCAQPERLHRGQAALPEMGT